MTKIQLNKWNTLQLVSKYQLLLICTIYVIFESHRLLTATMLVISESVIELATYGDRRQATKDLIKVYLNVIKNSKQCSNYFQLIVALMRKWYILKRN